MQKSVSTLSEDFHAQRIFRRRHRRGGEHRNSILQQRPGSGACAATSHRERV
jgi:hypothetical protein